MEAVTIITYIFSASFIMMALALFFAYRRTGHYGMFLMGITYGASAGLAIVLKDWWPLFLGYFLVWMLKWLGLDPDADLRKRQRQAAEQGPAQGEEKK